MRSTVWLTIVVLASGVGADLASLAGRHWLWCDATLGPAVLGHADGAAARPAGIPHGAGAR
jgi:hypothetical protein